MARNWALPKPRGSHCAGSRDQFGVYRDDGGDPYERLTEEASVAPPRFATDFCLRHYLMGERTPHLDPRARGALVGLTAAHTRADGIRAYSRESPSVCAIALLSLVK